MENKITIYYKENTFIPTKATPDSAGYDIAVPKDFIIEAKSFYLMDTKIVVDFNGIKEDVAMHILPRSSLFKKKNVLLANSVGLVEKDYCGAEDTIKMALFNMSDEQRFFKEGERIGQFYFVKICDPDIIDVQPIKKNLNKVRGGFGASGGYTK